MGWFGGSAEGASGPGREAVVTVFKAAGGQTAGGAVQLAGRWLLTCAHVVNDALGRPHDSVAEPADALVDVAFAALPGSGRLRAVIRHWIPPRAGPVGSIGWLGDLAVLELRDDPPPAARPVRWQEMTAGQHVVAWYGSGQEFSYAKAEVGSCEGPLGYLDGDLAGAAIGPGYSGGPLCLADGTAVGLVVAHLPAPPGPFTPAGVIRRGIGIPWQTLRTELAPLLRHPARTGSSDGPFPPAGTVPLRASAPTGGFGSPGGAGPAAGVGQPGDAAPVGGTGPLEGVGPAGGSGSRGGAAPAAEASRPGDAAQAAGTGALSGTAPAGGVGSPGGTVPAAGAGLFGDALAGGTGAPGGAGPAAGVGQPGDAAPAGGNGPLGGTTSAGGTAPGGGAELLAPGGVLIGGSGPWGPPDVLAVGGRVRPAARLEQPLAALLADPVIRADRSGQLAGRYGLAHPRDGSAPTYRELADFLCGHPRAAADLAEIHAPALATEAERTALNRLIAVGHAEGLALLSTGESGELLAHLGESADRDATALSRAVRGALPYAHLPAVLCASRLSADAVGEAARALESFGGDSAGTAHGTPRVPALLRVVEYLAVLAPAQSGDALRAWTERVAQRLGIPGAALSERRQDAAEWEVRQREGRRPTVVVELDRHDDDPADHYRCALWLTRPDGTPARVEHGPERPLPGASIAALVRDTADAVGGGPVLVEVWVDADHLQLPVDEWDDAEPAELSAPLGEDFHVVLRCKTTLRKPSALARRWAGRTLGEPLVVDGRRTDPKAAVVRLKKEWDCGRVVIHGPAEQRNGMLRACLLLGVPVVLWDRAADGYEHAPRLDPVGPAGPLGGLPERLRRFRIDTYADPARFPARPTLLWEDPDRPLPDGLWLADPEGTEV